jgi:hypothetical protein
MDEDRVAVCSIPREMMLEIMQQQREAEEEMVRQVRAAASGTD